MTLKCFDDITYMKLLLFINSHLKIYKKDISYFVNKKKNMCT